MDWSNPNGEQITLDMTRVRTNGSSRIGSLLINPGGPGGQVTSLCLLQAQGLSIVSDKVMEQFDLICPDPRGVGKSSRVKCDSTLWQQTPSYFINDEASFQEVLDFNKKLGESCLNLTGPLLGFVDTTSAARDLDAIRIALGDAKLNWLGFSYGTQLGAAYAELFPQNVRAMVLDGVVNHAESAVDSLVLSAWAMEDEVTRLLAWCNTNSTCAFHNATQDAALAWDQLIANANKNPIPAPGCLTTSNTTKAGTCSPNATGYDIIFNMENNFGSATSWAEYSQAIKEAIDGNATLLSTPIPGASSLGYPNLAIGCLDWQMNASTFNEHTTIQNLGAAMFPHTLGSSMFLQFATTCVGWPFEVTNPQHWLNATQMAKAPPILIAQSEHDPATPLPWAYGVAAQIPSATLVTRVGDGHTSYHHSAPMAAIVDAYLVNLTVPAQNTIVVDTANNPGGVALTQMSN
jgi:pimeloyl-ACP methyl ester carboxylesterase